MFKGINYWAFPASADGLPPDPIEALRRAKELGYDAFELTVERHGLVSLETTRDTAERVRTEAARVGIELETVACGLAWGDSPTHPDENVRRRAIEIYRKVIEVASWLGARTLLYLPGMVSAVFIPDFPTQPYEAVRMRATEAIDALLPVAEKAHICLGIENVWNRFLLSPVEMRDFIDSFASPSVGAYFDVGNVMLYGHPEDWIHTLGRRIAAVHLKDFRVQVGNLDGFVDLLSGDVNFPAVMEAFRAIGYRGPFTAEIVPGRAGAVERAVAAMRLIESY